jgi:hypothetical protein
MGKEKRHKRAQQHDTTASSLDAILEESRSLRRQMADDLNQDARAIRRMSRHFARSRRAADPDEQSA